MESKRIEKKMRKIESKREKDRVFKKDSSFLKVEENVFDIPTLHLLYNFAKKGYIKELGGSVSTGKEANIFHAAGNDDNEYAVKIYRISASTFKLMDPYIIKDRRFESIGNDRKKMIFAWARKEFQNLKRINRIGIPSPEPIAVDRNILIMSFLGKDGVRYPQLRDYDMTREEVNNTFETILQYMNLMYNEADLIHSDLSEYNILMNPDKGIPYIIDVGQAVTTDHPNAYEFLYRDAQNMIRFFSKYDIELSPKDIIERTVGKKEDNT
ncbi:MAG: serine protein kinase RIO [Methanosarcinaceae archaeon]|nr:serine protein kinase RIO [Methanosarcinaceae archaeon]